MHWNQNDSSRVYVSGNLVCALPVTGSFMTVTGMVTANHCVFSLAPDMVGFATGQLRTKYLAVQGEGFACPKVDAEISYAVEWLVSKYPGAQVLTEECFVEAERGYSDMIEIDSWPVNALVAGKQVFSALSAP